jgi:hypothetical protein
VFGIWFSAVAEGVQLGVEAQTVVALRLLKIVRGGSAAGEEAILMLTEKVAAAGEALATVMKGGSGQRVIRRYRSRVRANARRLSGK